MKLIFCENYNSDLEKRSSFVKKSIIFNVNTSNSAPLLSKTECVHYLDDFGHIKCAMITSPYVVHIPLTQIKCSLRIVGFGDHADNACVLPN